MGLVPQGGLSVYTKFCTPSTLSPTPFGVLKLTTSKLLRPSGQEWDIKGVVPDRRTNQKTGPGVEFGSKDDVELVEALRIFDLR